MPRWLRHSAAWVAIFTFALGARLHLPFVQLAAWVSMTASYAEAMPVGDALRLAISGEELCGGCRFVRDAEHAKQTGEALLAKALGAATPLVTPDFAPVRVVPPALTAGFAHPEDEYAGRLWGAPEPPPPRV